MSPVTDPDTVFWSCFVGENCIIPGTISAKVATDFTEIQHSKVPACRVTLSRFGELNALASVLVKDKVVFPSFLPTSTGKIACMLLVCLYNLYHNMYIYTLYLYIHVCKLWFTIASHCSSLLIFVSHVSWGIEELVGGRGKTKARLLGSGKDKEDVG